MRPTILSLATLSVLGTLFADPVVDWNNAALKCIRTDRTNPPRASRALAIAHLSIFDTVNGVDREFHPYYVQTLAPTGVNVEAAVASAAQTALLALFPAQATNINPVAERQLAAIPASAAKDAGMAWGTAVAQAILALRAQDGSTNVVPFTPGTQPGDWRPTPPANAPALLPGWGQLTPFTLASGNQFRPQPPPPITNSAYSFELNVVKMYGGTTSTLRTEDQAQVARFWADGPGTVTPPGHWNVIAQQIAANRNNTLQQNARLFALLNLGLADAAITCWDTKYAYPYWRPVTAIREADTDGNPETAGDPTWTPLIVTPPFPEYTSGHSTFSRTGATILALFYGTDHLPFSTSSDHLPGVTRSFSSPSAAANESGISRIYGGIHFPSGNVQGQAVGYRLGQHVAMNFLTPLTSAVFTAVTRAGETTELQLAVEPGTVYVIRASSDLKSWVELGQVSSPTGMAFFKDSASPGGQRYYEAVAR